MRNIEMLKGFLALEGLLVERVWLTEATYFARIFGSVYRVNPRTLSIYPILRGIE